MTKYGVVFAGGGAKGAYQIGAWKAFNELGLEFEAVVGASIGAINGALFALQDWEKAYSIYRNIKMRDVIQLPDELCDCDNLFDFANAKLLASEIRRNFGLNTAPLRAMLEQNIDEEKLLASPIDFGLMTFSVTAFKPVEMFKNDIPKGKLADYLLASACLPVFRNVKIDNQRFVDGGVYDNMPASMLIKKGIKDIILVDIRGIGRVASMDTTNVNITIIRPDEVLGGLLDLSAASIEQNMIRGYLDTLKVFGKLVGTKYYFTQEEYEKLPGIASDLEQLALLYGFNRYEKYTAEVFLEKIRSIHAQNKEKYERIKSKINLVDLSKSFTGYRRYKFKAEMDALRPLMLEAAADRYANEHDMRLLQRFLPNDYKAVMAIKELNRQALSIPQSPFEAIN